MSTQGKPRSLPPPPPARPLPSFPDPETGRLDGSISLHDGDFEELFAPPSPSTVRTYGSGKVSSKVVYAISAGSRPGELVLRPLDPDEEPPEGALVARLRRVHVAPVSRIRAVGWR